MAILFTFKKRGGRGGGGEKRREEEVETWDSSVGDSKNYSFLKKLQSGFPKRLKKE